MKGTDNKWIHVCHSYPNKGIPSNRKQNTKIDKKDMVMRSVSTK